MSDLPCLEENVGHDRRSADRLMDGWTAKSNVLAVACVYWMRTHCMNGNPLDVMGTITMRTFY